MSAAEGRGDRPAAPPLVAAGEADETAAAAYAARLAAPRLERAAWEAADPPPLALWCDADGLALRGPPRGTGARRPQLTLASRPGRDPLLRALGPLRGVTVIDATAGWGVDAAVIAAAGAQVLMIEHLPVVALLLEEALERARRTAPSAAARLEVVCGEAVTVLSDASDVDVVYLDPLFPGREQRRTSTPTLQWLRTLASLARDASEGGDESTLLRAAQQRARRRVVVKRGRSDPFLAGVAPSGSVTGRTNRYDLYPGAARVLR